MVFKMLPFQTHKLGVIVDVEILFAPKGNLKIYLFKDVCTIELSRHFL